MTVEGEIILVLQWNVLFMRFKSKIILIRLLRDKYYGWLARLILQIKSTQSSKMFITVSVKILHLKYIERTKWASFLIVNSKDNCLLYQRLWVDNKTGLDSGRYGEPF